MTITDVVVAQAPMTLFHPETKQPQQYGGPWWYVIHQGDCGPEIFYAVAFSTRDEAEEYHRFASAYKEPYVPGAFATAWRQHWEQIKDKA